MPRIVCCALGLALTSLWVGCGSSGPDTYEVTGRVTFDGQPVAEGEILFRAADGSQGSWAAKIVDGQYTMQSTAGKKRVEVSASREIAGTVVEGGGGEGPGFEMYIPGKYNAQSELTAEVTPDGPNEFDFALEP